jgi:hypothetical protein
MVQRGNRLRFALKALLCFSIGGQMRRQDLDRDGAIQARVERAIHLSHAACSQWRLDFVRSESGARAESHGCAQL